VTSDPAVDRWPLWRCLNAGAWPYMALSTAKMAQIAIDFVYRRGPASTNPLEVLLAGARHDRENRRMDILKILAELRDERDRLEEAILTIERLARGQGRRRGRPPKWMTEQKRRGRPPGSKNKTKGGDAA
jgi:hypothetical protein